MVLHSDLDVVKFLHLVCYIVNQSSWCEPLQNAALVFLVQVNMEILFRSSSMWITPRTWCSVMLPEGWGAVLLYVYCRWSYGGETPLSHCQVPYPNLSWPDFGHQGCLKQKLIAVYRYHVTTKSFSTKSEMILVRLSLFPESMLDYGAVTRCITGHNECYSPIIIRWFEASGDP